MSSDSSVRPPVCFQTLPSSACQCVCVCVCVCVRETGTRVEAQQTARCPQRLSKRKMTVIKEERMSVMFYLLLKWLCVAEPSVFFHKCLGRLSEQPSLWVLMGNYDTLTGCLSPWAHASERSSPTHVKSLFTREPAATHSITQQLNTTLLKYTQVLNPSRALEPAAIHSITQQLHTTLLKYTQVLNPSRALEPAATHSITQQLHTTLLKYAQVLNPSRALEPAATHSITQQLHSLSLSQFNFNLSVLYWHDTN